MKNLAAVTLAAAVLGAGATLTPVVEPESPEPRQPEPNGIPDRVSLETDSPFYFPKWGDLGVRYNGGECKSVVEFCVSEGWIRSQIFHGGRAKQERGKFVTVTHRGTIEPYWRS